MHAYELRVVDSTGPGTVNSPDRTLVFAAVNDYAAIDRLNVFATTLPAHEGVWLVPDGQTASIASEQGSAGVTV